MPKHYSVPLPSTRCNPDSRTNYDKELAAQGIGNMICGLLGALPMTGVIVRSSANVEAGAKTRLSTILHGGWLLLFVSLLAFVLRMIPTAALAAMLVYTGYKLINFKAIRDLRQYGWGEVVIYFVNAGNDRLHGFADRRAHWHRIGSDQTSAHLFALGCAP